MKNYIKRIYNSFNFRFTLFLDKILFGVEKIFILNKFYYVPSDFVFIIGAPRTGSTFIFELLSYKLNYHYHTNARMLFPLSKLGMIYEKLLIFALSEQKGESKNFYGHLSHPLGPSEGFRFWRTFFPRKHNQNDLVRRLNPKNKEDFIKLSISRFYHEANGKPVLIKNLEMALRLPVLEKLFPNSHILILLRDPNDIMESILKARKNLYNDINFYWSMRPASYGINVDASPKDQIQLQVLSIYEEILDQIKIMRKVKFTAVWYEDVLEDQSILLSWAQGIHDHNLNDNINVKVKHKNTNPHYSFDWNADATMKIMQEIIDQPNTQLLSNENTISR